MTLLQFPKGEFSKEAFDEIVRLTQELDELRAENAELRERLACAESACSFVQAEANKYLERLEEARRLAEEWRDRAILRLEYDEWAERTPEQCLMPWEVEK